MASQYAGWAVTPDGYFAMGSGPLRAKARVEHELFEKLGYAEDAAARRAGARDPHAADRRRGRVGRRQGRRAPDGDHFRRGARRPAWPAACRWWRAWSRPACTRWRRSASTSAASSARWARRRCAPTAKNDLRAIGRTNDCVLYGGQARYVVNAGDDGAGRARRTPARLGVVRLRHALLRHLQALRQRLLQDRPAAVQPGRSVADQRDERAARFTRALSTRTFCGRRSMNSDVPEP